MAEWLRRGLQIPARRFDSGSGLHFSAALEVKRASATVAAEIARAMADTSIRVSLQCKVSVPLPR